MSFYSLNRVFLALFRQFHSKQDARMITYSRISFNKKTQPSEKGHFAALKSGQYQQLAEKFGP